MGSHFNETAMKAKHIYYLALWLLLWNTSSLQLFAQNQIRITTNVLPPYSPYIQDYPGTGNHLQVYVSNLSGKNLSVRLLGKLEGDNGVVIQTSPNYRPLHPLQINANDVNRPLTRSELEGLFDLGQIEVLGMNKNELYRGLPLPEGNYQLCIQAFDNATIKPLSAEFPMGCSGLIPVRIVEPPILISPFDTEEVIAKTPQNQLFSWSAPVGILPNQVEYTLRIVELPAANVDPNVFIDAMVLPKTGLEVKYLRTTTFLYGPAHPTLQYGKRYAWRVQAHPTSQKLNIMNEGKSPVQVFTYGPTLKDGVVPILQLVQNPLFPISPLTIEKPTESKLLSSDFSKPCECNPVEYKSDQTVDNKKVLEDKKATIANFSLELLAGVTETKGKLNGMGMIPVPMINSGYIKLRVQLIDVQCNAQGEVIGGIVKGLHKNGFPGLLPTADLPNAPGMKLSPQDIQKIGDRFAASKDELVSNLKNSASSIGFELPWGIDKGVGPLRTVIAITDMTFTPKRASFNANTWIETPSSTISGLALSGYNICVSPQKPCGDGILYLAKEAKLSEYFSLYGDDEGLAGNEIFAPDTTKVTYVSFDQNGFQKMRIHGLMSPPALIKVEGNEPLRISVNADITKGFKDWTAQLSFDKFYVKGLPDFKFAMNEAQPAIYDHSELTTPGKLPDDYESPDGQAGWQGLFFPELSIELPEFIKNESNTPVTGKIQNLIYDDNGFTGRALVENILTINDGSLGGWFYSIDSFDAMFKNSGFVSSSMKGKIVLPIFDHTDATTHLDYGSTISKNEVNGKLEFQLGIHPADPHQKMNVPVWNRSKLSLYDGSAINVTYNNQGFEAKAYLNGSLDLAAGPITIPAAKFTGLVLSTKPNYFSLESLVMTTASPQKSVADKPFNLEFTGKAKGGKPGFTFHCDVDLSEGAGISGEGDLILTFSTGNNAKGRPDWKYEGFEGMLQASGDFGPVSASGKVSLYANDPEKGDRFEGEFGISVLGKFKAEGTAVFGKSAGADSFGYWYIGGFMQLNPPVGVPLVGPVNFKGFGGGFYSNAVQTISNDGAPSYQPQKGTRGFEASVMVGLATPYLLDAKGTLKMSFDEKWTPLDLGIIAKAWFLGTDQKSSLAQGDLNLNFAFDQSKISMEASLNAKMDFAVGSISATLPVKMEVDYSSNPNWYFAIGAPTPGGRQMLAVKLLKVDVQFGSYFVMGSGGNPISNSWSLPPAPYNFTGEQMSLFKGVSSLRRDNFGVNPLNQNNNPFLAFGAGYSMNFDYEIGPFYMHMDGGIGFDMALKKVDTPCTPGGAIPGMYGWYAQGQVYAALTFELGIDVDIWVYEGRIQVAKLSAGALLRGGLMNPVWFNGQVAVKYSVLRGLVKGNFNFDFWYNRDSRCDPAYLPPNPFADLPLISSVGPSGTDQKTSILTPLVATFNYPVENKLIVEIEIPKDKTVDNNAIGTTYGNTFVQEFKLQFKEPFELVAKSNGGSEPTNNAGSMVMGKNEEGERNYAATFYRDNSLLPNTTYEMTVGLKVFVYNPKKGDELEPYLFKNQSVEQTEKVTFQTGGCPSDLSKGSSTSDAILTSYPYEGQRYFMKGENTKPFIKLKKYMEGCLNGMGANNQYDLIVAMTPLEGDAFANKTSQSVLTLLVNFDGERYSYGLPAGMKNNTLYRLQLIKTPKDDYLDKLIADGYSGVIATKKITTTNIYKNIGSTGYKLSSPGNTVPIINSSLTNPNGKATTANGFQPKTNNTVLVNQNYKNIDTHWASMVNTYTDENKLNEIGKNANLTSQIAPESIKEKISSLSIGQLNDVTTKLADFNAKKDKLKKSLAVEMYRYYFKSSKYNTMAEKMAAAKFTTASPGTTLPSFKFGDFVTGSMSTDEGFDRFDLNFEELGEGEVRPPLLLLKATANSKWFQQVAKPIADLLNQAPDTYFKADKYNPQSKLLENTLDGFKRSMVQFGTYFFPTEQPYENTEIYRLFPSEIHQ